MSDSPEPSQLKALDGTVKTVADGPAQTSQSAKTDTSTMPLRSARTESSAGGEATPSGQTLTGKQEHCVLVLFTAGKPKYLELCLLQVDLKRELIAQQVDFEISELASTTALQRFGAPFRSEYGEIAPVDSDLPLLRYIFCHHVRNFPFLDQAKEKEFWQDKLQVVKSYVVIHVTRISS